MPKPAALERPFELAVEEFSTVAPPGVVPGVEVWSPTALKKLMWDGTQWIGPSAAGGVAPATAAPQPVLPPGSAPVLGLVTSRAAREDHQHVMPAATTTNGGAMSATDKSTLDTVAAANVLAGAGLVGGGSLAGGDVTVNVAANDGTIIVTPNGIQVGYIVDANHGNRSGGALHAVATQSVAGFLSAADKLKLDGIATGAVAAATSAPSPVLPPGSSAVLGAVTTRAAREDHQHVMPAATTTTGGAMSAADKLKLDGIADGATVGATAATVAPAPDLPPGSTAVLGASARYAREDHQHVMPAATQVAGGALSAADKTKLDSVATGATADAPATSAPQPVLPPGSTAVTGIAPRYALEDHQHVMPAATQAAGGAMSAADKTKLDGIAAGATVGAALVATGGPAGSATNGSPNATTQGTATTAARSDHWHPSATAATLGTVMVTTASTAGTLASGAPQAAQAGAGSAVARSDHQHPPASASNAGLMSATDYSKLAGIAAGATVAPTNSGATPPAIAVAGVVGTAGTYAREGHTHAHGTQTDGTMHAVATTTVAGFLSAADKTKLDGIATGATVGPGLAGGFPATVDASNSVVGVGTTASRADHQHQVLTAAPVTIGATNAVGTAAGLARADHVHAHGAQTDPTMHAVATTSVAGFLSAADKVKLDGIAAGATATAAPPTNSGIVPLAIALASVLGTAGTYAREDHTHAHGAQTDGTMHAVASPTVAGFMSAADKSKLDGIAAGATVGPTLVAADTPTWEILSGGDGLQGSATTAARSDHTHGLALASTTVAGAMSAADKAKLDGIPAGGAAGVAIATSVPQPVLPPGSAAALGAITTRAAREDHQHVMPLATTTVGGAMSAADKSKLDGIAAGATAGATLVASNGTAGTSTDGVSAAAQQGAATTAARSDHWHPQATATTFGMAVMAPSGVAGSLASGSSQTGQFGANGQSARADHWHPPASASNAGLMSATDYSKLAGIAAGATNTAAPPTNSGATPPAIAVAGVVGTAGTYAREGHTHAHGAQTDGTMHAVATTSVAGFLSAADKSKLDGIAAGATAGATLQTANAATNSIVVNTTGSQGTATTAARADHNHGLALASASVAGAMSAADKSKLDGIAAGATATAAPPTFTGSAPQPVGANAAMGTVGSYAATDHVHAHGNIVAPTVVDTYHGDFSDTEYGFAGPLHYRKLWGAADIPALGCDIKRYWPRCNTTLVDDSGWGISASGTVGASAMSTLGKTNIEAHERIQYTSPASAYGASFLAGFFHLQRANGFRYTARVRPVSIGQYLFVGVSAHASWNTVTTSFSAVRNVCGLYVTPSGCYVMTADGTTVSTQGPLADLTPTDVITNGVDVSIWVSNTGLFATRFRPCIQGAIWGAARGFNTSIPAAATLLQPLIYHMNDATATSRILEVGAQTAEIYGPSQIMT